jgi:hypothetical protein
MSDILSGGRIDESTSGPIPSKEDDRKRDILSEQRENQRQDSIGGTEEPPKPRPAEQIPEPPQVAPPLPVIPSFDFSIVGSALEETREIARQTIFDVIKNVTINGQGPSIDGSAISFNIPQQPPASEAFFFQGVAIPQSQIPQITQPPTIPQPEPTQEIQSVVVAPPSRTRAPQIAALKEEGEEVQEPLPPTQPPTKITPPKMVVSEIPTETEEPISVAPLPQTMVPPARLEVSNQEPEKLPKIPTERVVTTPTLEMDISSVEVPEKKTPQEEALQPQQSVPVQIQQAEEYEVKESRVPAVPSTQQQPIRLDATENETDILIAETPEKPPTQDSVRVAAPQTIEAPKPESTISPPPSVEPQRESIGEKQDRENSERSIRDRQIRSALGLGEVSPFDEPPEVAPNKTIPIGEKQDRENNERAKRDREIRSNLGLGEESPFDKYEGISFGERQDVKLSERKERDKEIRGNLGLGEISPFDEETEVAKGFKAAEEKYRQKRESDPNFDRESDVRQRGERYSDFKERQEALKQERAEKVEAIKERAELSKRLKEGGIAETPSGMVPVALTRADGQKRILAYLASEFVGVVESGDNGERVTSLPADTDYYEAGGGGSCIGLALYKKTVENTTTQVWIGAGTVAGGLPSGFDPSEGKSIASGGSGNVWAEVNIDQYTGEIISVAVTGGASTPNNTETSFYYTIGYYEYDGNSATVTNYGCGSIDVTVCRNWFAAEAPFYGVTMTRCGCSGGGGGGGGSDFN